MSLDAKIQEAIEESVKEHGQSEALAKQIVAWMEAITSGKQDLLDPSATARRVKLLYEATIPSNGQDGRLI
jgi:hypothetical protein